ncbi:SAM-dependent methyltransferase [Weissella uvarum]|uniref:class I SAM-dependent DNA methyltransferase n=1 Tax=Weissella uvarum TaxID=1479233 RepID=UPI0019618A61|nr:class I SAM-dependent methyltransferase [Weissella uvarum]MBM7616489.1 SAM-dependent methyltransferase [Weissella uvarum]MCM0595050.1 class I SAM-dependent methyltransferase [Weissella uvarum]
MNYGTFAGLYDQLFDEEAYEDWLAYAKATIKNPKGRLLELAGGAGRLAIMLKQAGINDVYNFDLSPEMLGLAAKHAEEAQVDLPLIEGDMREWSDLDLTFQTITCFADSLNYLENEQDVLQTFKQVYNHLEAGGQFIFDVITPVQTDEVYPGYMFNWHDDETAFMWSSFGVEGQKHNVEHELTFFLYQEDIDGYRQLQEIHTERTYPLATYEKLLKEAGFTDVQVTADFGRTSDTKEATRWFFNTTKGA